MSDIQLLRGLPAQQAVYPGYPLLPTGGNGDSPSLTTQALAVRTADKLVARLG